MNAFSLWIERVGLTTREVALALGVGDPAVSKLRKDGYWPRRDIALRIYRFTGGEVAPNDMLADDTPVEKTVEYRLGRAAINRARRHKDTINGKRTKRLKRGTAAGRDEQRPE